MSEIEVHISLLGKTLRVGTLFRQAARGRESVTFVPVKGFLDSLLPLNGFIMLPSPFRQIRSHAEPVPVSDDHVAR